MKDLTTALAVKNGYAKERYVELVRKGVEELYPDKSDEIAIHRKEIAFIREVLEKHLGIKLPDTEFTALDEGVEFVKTKAKTETGIK